MYASLATVSEDQSYAWYRERVLKEATRERNIQELIDRRSVIVGGPARCIDSIEWFERQGPRESGGRSLRELDLRRRLFKYPCSYMIYSPAFDALPAAAKEAVYARMWDVLSGKEKRPLYTSRLSAADRQAIVQILRATKKDLPAYFQLPS